MLVCKSDWGKKTFQITEKENRSDNIPGFVDLCCFKRIYVNSQNSQHIPVNSVKYSEFSLGEIVLIKQNTRDHKKKCTSTRMFDNLRNESKFIFICL